MPRRRTKRTRGAAPWRRTRSASSLNNLALLYHNLAALYHAQGKYAEAEPLLKRALAIWAKALGPAHPDVATTLNNLAALYRKTNRLADAEVMENRAKAIRAARSQERSGK